MAVNRSEWEWFGHACHLIVGSNCQFHMATKVGDYLISTVGEYLPDAPVREILAETRGVTLKGQGDARLADFMQKIGFEDIGYKRKFETMVFRLTDQSKDCGCPEVADWAELEVAAYNDCAEASKGHYEMCDRWATK